MFLNNCKELMIVCVFLDYHQRIIKIVEETCIRVGRLIDTVLQLVALKMQYEA